MTANKIAQLTKYCKTQGIVRLANGLKDFRRHAEIPTREMFLALFYMYVLNVPSLLALEQQLGTRKMKKLIRSLPGREQVAKKDALRNAVMKMDSCRLEQGLVQQCKRMKRNKTWPMQERYGGMIPVSFDLTELYSFRIRHESECQVRQVTVKGRDGSEHKVPEYYHQAVQAQIVGEEVKPILGSELVRPGEGELTAAKWLLAGLVRSYGKGFFHLVVCDAIYACAPFINACLREGKHVVTFVKREDLKLYREAELIFKGMRAEQGPDTEGESKERRKMVRWRAWDQEGLESLQGVKCPLRVVRIIEESYTLRGKFIDKKEFLVLTTAPKNLLTANQVRLLGHKRWEIENNGARELKQAFHLSHCFVHDPVAIRNLLLIAYLAYNLMFCFFLRRLGMTLENGQTFAGFVRDLIDAANQLRQPLHRFWFCDTS